MSIRRHTLYNILGSIAPLGISLVTVPIYLHTIGEARYGVLAIVWLFTGYFGVFDMGLARASAYHLARQRDEAPGVRSTTFWTALWLNLSFGLLGAVVLYVVAQPVFAHFFHMSEALRRNVLVSLPWIAATLPLGTLGGVLVGALQARERFGYISLTGVLSTVLTQVVPLIVAVFISPELTWLIPAIVLARASGLVLLSAGVWRFLPIVPSALFDRRRARALFTYGGWISLTNIVGPVLTTFDRMLIGALLSVQAVTYYTVPYNLVTRVAILPGALSNSLFPRFSRAESGDGGRLAEQSLVMLISVMTTLTVSVMAILPLFLSYWISPEFSQHGAAVGMILLAGVWINGLAFIPYGLLQGQGRPDITAKLHLIELPFFLLILWGGIHWLGLAGAALAWSLRVAADALLIFYFAKLLPTLRYALPAIVMIGLAAVVAPQVIISVQSLLAVVIVLFSMVWALWIAPELRHTLVTAALRFGRFFLARIGIYP
ncbi:Putative polysaccharide biosynthesis protein: putative membrane protein involved in the export of O-antigen and teichoic acid [Acidithiobacillus ferrivorans]|uniref:Polysaccharide biosynthesis protein n=1 Tax=Acidithiobacillus ferrivorans TaxID=160808 RepID=A0A060UX29_9PROT|nr:flippase [Acidithiobacillus ferrivorans]CDQ11303.1 Polysaccharide biosynthesis protein [Acidithiobacillus ferrivorans]SMH67662.1 Putative polysaccharide biosynthesis protein: putative membrane protein involved in the export of O-antigen and teichoic acid [Acidithiobacillus ferrivorans]